MTKSKKIIVAIVLLILFMTLVVIIVENHYRNIFEESSANSNISVRIETSGFFQPAGMGGKEYRIIVCEDKGVFRDVLLSDTFWFVNDGAMLADNNISVEWFDDYVKITIDSDEMNAIVYTCNF